MRSEVPAMGQPSSIPPGEHGESSQGWQPHPGPYPPRSPDKNSRSPAQRLGLLLAILVGIAVALVAGFLLVQMISYDNCTDHAHGRAEYAKC